MQEQRSHMFVPLHLFIYLKMYLLIHCQMNENSCSNHIIHVNTSFNFIILEMSLEWFA